MIFVYSRHCGVTDPRLSSIAYDLLPDRWLQDVE
jgi:hypothetical protein